MEFEPAGGEGEPEVVPEFRSMPEPASSARKGAVPSVDPAEHNVVFLSLVTGDDDIVGLVAYSIYKQNKYDWLMAFNRHLGRNPNPDEVQSYLHGESTPRRLATYRHLAEATLEGRGLEVPGSLARKASTSRSVIVGQAAPLPKAASGRPVLIGVIIAVLIAIGLVWYFHGGPAPTGK